MADYPLSLKPESNYAAISFSNPANTYEYRMWELLVAPDRSRMDSWQYQYAKRAVDMSLSFIMLTLSLVPGLIIAALVAGTSQGPVFYREWRVGRRGRPFRIWKFRSMSARTDSPLGVGVTSGTVFQLRVNKSGCDTRVTPVGKFIRKWSLDELPQLLNVLRGEMSLVGPRPVVEAEIPLYGILSEYYYAAVPGLSGLWQVSGRSNIKFERRVTLDVSYVHKWSLMEDCKILLRTIPAVLKRTGAR